jgi:hypothetical protein
MWDRENEGSREGYAQSSDPFVTMMHIRPFASLMPQSPTTVDGIVSGGPLDDRDMYAPILALLYQHVASLAAECAEVGHRPGVGRMHLEPAAQRQVPDRLLRFRQRLQTVESLDVKNGGLGM